MALLNRSLNGIMWVLWVTWVSNMWAQKSCRGSPLQTQPLNKLIFWTSGLAIWDTERVALLSFIKLACVGLVPCFPVLKKAFEQKDSAFLCNLHPRQVLLLRPGLNQLCIQFWCSGWPVNHGSWKRTYRTSRFGSVLWENTTGVGRAGQILTWHLTWLA